jgi:hypothetical protein
VGRTQVALVINMVKMDSGNGFDLLWHILALSVPGFAPSIQVKIPRWQDDDIFDFALAFLLFFHLQAKNWVIQDDCAYSMTFLNAIAEPAYANAATILVTCITNFHLDFDDGFLPSNLCVMGLMTQLHTNAHTPVQAVIPRI